MQSEARPDAPPPEDFGTFLVELSVALNRTAMYPAGHPSLDQVCGSMIRRLEALLAGRPRLAVGVARKQLVIDGRSTDDRNPVLGSLADRLHRQQIGALVFERGASSEELISMLQRVAREPDRDGVALGLGPPDRLRWPSIRLYPITYERLELVTGGHDPDAGEDERAEATQTAQLWLGLARAAMAVNPAGTERVATEPSAVASAINQHDAAIAYDQVVVGYMLEIAGELSTASPKAGADLRLRISRLIKELDPATLRRLVEFGGDLEQRRRFLDQAVDGFAAEAVILLARAAGDAAHQPISASMLRLLSRMSTFAVGEAGSGEADATLRDQVRTLLKGWTLEDPNPEGYTTALTAMASSPALQRVPVSMPVDIDPIRIVQMALEIGTLGSAGHQALANLEREGRMAELIPFLAGSAPDDPVTGVVVERLASADRLTALLVETDRPVESLEPLLQALPLDRRITLLLDVLHRLGAGPVRIALNARIRQEGDRATQLALARLPDAEPAMLQALLDLVAGVDAAQIGSVLDRYARHEDDGVRRTALRILFRSPTQRERSLCMAFTDRHEPIIADAIEEVGTGVPAAAIALIGNRIASPEVGPATRRELIRLLLQSDSPHAIDVLTRKIVVGRTLVLKQPKLAPPTPDVLMILAEMARSGAADPRIEVLVARARRSLNGKIRAASRGVQ